MVNIDVNRLPKLRQGDEPTWVSLFREYYAPLCAYAHRYLGRKELAEEIVSETFFILWRQRETLDIRTSLKSYLFQAVCNNSLNYLRKLKKEDKLEDYLQTEGMNNLPLTNPPGELPSESLIVKELSETINLAVGNLPPQQRRVFLLKRYEGKKISEIAEILGISVKTTEMHLAKAIMSLRKNLKEYLPGFLIAVLIQ